MINCRMITRSVLVLFLGLTLGSHTLLAQQLLTTDSEKIDFAQELLNQSQYELAITQYQEFIGQYTQSKFLPDAYLGLGDGYFYLKDYTKAIATYQQYTEKFPEGKDKWMALLRWGQSLFLSNKPEDAAAKLMVINEKDVSKEFLQTYYFFLGQTKFEQGELGEANTNFEKAIQVDPIGGYASQVYIEWGNALLQAENYGEALTKFTKAFETAQTDPLKAEALMRTAQTHFSAHDYEKAAAAFDQIIATYPSHAHAATLNWFTTLLTQENYDALIARYETSFKDMNAQGLQPVHMMAIEAYVNKGQVDKALALLDQLLTSSALKPSDKDKAILQKASILTDAKRFPEALAFIDQNKALDEQVQRTMLLLQGQINLDNKEYDKAWSVYATISQQAPDLPMPFCGMAHVRFAQEKYAEAAEHFMDCYTVTTQEPARQETLYSAILMYQKALMDSKVEEAATTYLKEYAQQKQAGDVKLILADSYTRAQKYDQAIASVTSLIESPDNTIRRKALFDTAYNNQLAGNLDEAAALYAKIIDENTGDEVNLLTLKNSAAIYFAKNETDKAGELLERIVRKFETHELPVKDYLWIAQNWETKNQPERMLSILAAAKDRPHSPEEELGIKYFSAQAHRLSGDCTQAVTLYDEIVSIKESNSYSSRSQLGKALCSVAADKAKGQQELEKLISDNPDDVFVTVNARLELARLAQENKELDKAVNLYMMVALLYNDPEYSPQSLVQAGIIFQELNKPDEAKKVYNQIIDEYPQSPLVPKAKDLMRTIK